MCCYPAFKCPLQLCNKTFAVRSNARRHLRTHGVSVPPAALDKMGGPGGRSQAPQPFRVGFDTPVVVDVHDFGRTYVDGGGGGSGSGASGSGSGSGRSAAGENGSSGGGSANGGASGKAQRLRWVPQSLASRSNAARLRSLSPSSDMADLDLDAEYDDDEGEDRSRARGGRRDRSGQNQSNSQSHMSMSPATSLSTNSPRTPSLFSRRPPPELKIAPVPLQTSAPSDPSANPYAKYDERNSFAEAGTYPYHPEQVCIFFFSFFSTMLFSSPLLSSSPTTYTSCSSLRC